ncbi:hypothetical protein Scep_008942 [Stephania cephalantha]|uniref:L10-interacting MYB domain-containing protein n=1 Tax=Stephania cephalantha TaxID=152367 RepID=A0AAP0JSP9_9MAGN
MGVQTPTSNDRLRTIWTTAMDRYFIDLMLDQMGKGNRVDGHLFSKRAWKHMTTVFNAKFACQYSKDHLKNRHKTLRRLYKAVKSLLEQSGFDWDETQQMVTADDRIWSNYIKAHPEKRSYRTKSIPYFSDLCKIFETSTSTRRYDGLSESANLNNGIQETRTQSMSECLPSSTTMTHEDLIIDEQVLPSKADISDQLAMPSTSHFSSDGMIDAYHDIGAEDATITNEKKETSDAISTENTMSSFQAVADVFESASSNRSRTYWQPPMDRYFIDLMLDQVNRGNQFDGTFRRHAWMDMVELFNAKFGFNYDIVILKNRYKTLKRQHNAIKLLLDQEGFAWDETRQMVTADDSVWHDYIKAHPDAKQYITRPVTYYKDLCVIFKDASFDERHSDLAQNAEQHDEILGMDRCRMSRGLQSQIMYDTLYLDHDLDVSDHQNRRHFATPSISQSSKRLRQSDEDLVDGFAEKMAVDTTHLDGEMDISNHQNKIQLMTPSMSHNSKCLQWSTSEAVVNAIREMATVVASLSDKRKEPCSSCSPGENVIHALQAVPDIDEDLILDACDLLEDEKKAKTFLSLDIRLRKKWLMRKLRP